MNKLPQIKGPGETLYEQYKAKEEFMKLRIEFDKINTMEELKCCYVLDINDYKSQENVEEYEQIVNKIFRLMS